jgi:hypothetical protein
MKKNKFRGQNRANIAISSQRTYGAGSRTNTLEKPRVNSCSEMKESIIMRSALEATLII